MIQSRSILFQVLIGFVVALAVPSVSHGLQTDLDDQISEASDITFAAGVSGTIDQILDCLLYTSPSPRDATLSRMPSSA